ncbi:MAG: hypothetical protein GY928_02090 [Colwellia sp.]|nr:hypothetical protein [Colwellia sp.]
MNFKESLAILGIEKYESRIFNSNSHGELFHLYQYGELAEKLGETNWFKTWFEKTVYEAEQKWNRPESVFQHILSILVSCLDSDGSYKQYNY